MQGTHIQRQIVVHARQWDGTPQDAALLIAWMGTIDGSPTARYVNYTGPTPYIAISSLYTDTIAHSGYYVVCSHGGWWVRAREDFERDYMPLDERPHVDWPRHD